MLSGKEIYNTIKNKMPDLDLKYALNRGLILSMRQERRLTKPSWHMFCFGSAHKVVGSYKMPQGVFTTEVGSVFFALRTYYEGKMADAIKICVESPKSLVDEYNELLSIVRHISAEENCKQLLYLTIRDRFQEVAEIMRIGVLGENEEIMATVRGLRKELDSVLCCEEIVEPSINRYIRGIVSTFMRTDILVKTTVDDTTAHTEIRLIIPDDAAYFGRGYDLVLTD